MTQSQKDAIWFTIAVSLSAVILAGLWMNAPAPAPPRPVPSAYYVWQLQWNDDVRDAVRLADATANAFMVLIGEVNAAGGELRLQRGYPDWNALSKAHSPVTIVLRANAALGDLLQGEARERAIDYIADTLDAAIAEANTKGTTIRGIQLDYDCPSAKLASYEILVDALRPRYGKLEMSITALPTWLKWRDFEQLIDTLTYYVLQVHSLEKPTAFDQPITLCDTGRIPGYLRRAASIGAPYYLALPTYGYRFVFDEHGKFVSIVAEGPAPVVNSRQRVRTVMTDPGDIAATVRAIRANPPHALAGYVWFRLPVASDELNWPWPTLEAVRDGRTPKTVFTAELRNPSPGLYELHITNAGETWPPQPIRAMISYTPNAILASDTHNGFVAESRMTSSTILSGPAPRPGQSVLSAWFRMTPSRPESSPPAITVGHVELENSHE
ncbi:MAG: DUF3142 domain-containing protein [Candidatus Hydrogenedentes bacterium]|nr:DUF3142 domain-containing protein [Candidatus Hydrogenedentota bacterium]